MRCWLLLAGAVWATLAGCGGADSGGAPATVTPAGTALGSPSPSPGATLAPPTATLPVQGTVTLGSPARLLEAAAEGELERVRAQLARKIPVDSRDAQGKTALMLAAQGGHTAIVRVLLAAGAEVSAKDARDDTAYYFAALANHPETVGVLLDAGADRVGTKAFGGTPLIAVSERGYVEVVREILKRPNIPVNHVNNLGWTALIEAVILGDGGPRHQEIVRLLLAAGADAGIADRAGKTPLTLAREKGYAEIVRILEGGR